MIRFREFEALGLGVAGISDQSDGNCGNSRGGFSRTAPDSGVKPEPELHVETPLAVRDGFGKAVPTDAPVLSLPVLIPAEGDAAASRKRVCNACGVDAADLVCVQQVHGSDVIRVDAPQAQRRSADGIVTAARGLPLAIFVADCVPLYLFDAKRGTGGLVHAGREGTLRNIAAAAVSRLEQDYGASVRDIHALVGPSAGPCCYEVSPEMAASFAAAGLPVHERRLDLWEANVRQLIQAGVPREYIAVSRICTICDARFFSYRRDKTTNRNMALLVI